MAERQKIEACAEQQPEEHEQLELALTGIEREKQHRDEAAQTEQAVRQPKRQAQLPAQRAQHVVINGKTHAERAGEEKLIRLQRDGLFHQRNRRRSRPPVGRVCSYTRESIAPSMLTPPPSSDSDCRCRLLP